MAEVIVNAEQPSGEVVENDQPEIEESEIWPELRAILQSVAETSRSQQDALLNMTQQLTELQNRLPNNLQSMLESQQQTIQSLVREMLETVRVNLLNPNPENNPAPSPEPVVVVDPQAVAPPPEAAPPEPPAKPHRTRRRI